MSYGSTRLTNRFGFPFLLVFIFVSCFFEVVSLFIFIGFAKCFDCTERKSFVKYRLQAKKDVVIKNLKQL